MNSRILEIQNFINPYGKCIVAYSGGVDSSFLLYALSSIGKGNIMAVTFQSESSSIKEMADAHEFSISLGVEHVIINIDHLSIIGNNPKNRCYICKKYMFDSLYNLMLKKEYNTILDGSNFDDLKSDRPGRMAGKEYNVLSPLELLNFTKNEIRHISKALKLDIATKPSRPCYLTRFPHDISLTDNMLKTIKYIEEYIYNLELRQFRVRYVNSDKVSLELGRGNCSLDYNTISSIKRYIMSFGYKNIDIIYSDTNFDKM